MRYEPPATGDYISGLTARLMYDKAYPLVPQDTALAQNISAAQNLARLVGFQDERKVWETPSIISELEEFLSSYLFTGINGHLTGFTTFGDIVSSNLQRTMTQFEDYMARLISHYGSKEEAKKIIAPSLYEIKRRSDHLETEIRKIHSLPDVDKSIQRIMGDAFSNLGTICTVVNLAIKRFESL